LEQVAFRAHQTVVGDANDANGERRHVETFQQRLVKKEVSEPFGRVHQVETVDSGVGNRLQRPDGVGDGGGTSVTSGCRRLRRSLSPGYAEVCKDVALVGPDGDVGRGKEVVVAAVEVVAGRRLPMPGVRLWQRVEVDLRLR